MPESRRGSDRSGGLGDAEADDIPSAEAFLQTVAQSRLFAGEHLDSLIAGLSPEACSSAHRLADALIAAGELTHYQAAKLLKGRWRGMVVGAYQILAPLGRGGMGTVYLARSQSADAPPDDPLVALKVLPPKRAREDAKTLLRFRREMELGKHLDHPNITRTLETGEQQGVHFIAMEYVPGQSLRQCVVESGPLTVPDAARLFADVAAGLAHAHERGLIHRDLKPSNIMVAPDGRAKILDLGLALLVDEALPDDPTIVGGERYILGTMDYIAPEQTTDATNVAAATDIYALGCSIYFAVCGMPPFPGGTAVQKMRWHRTTEPPPVHSINPAVPPEFAHLIGRFMAKEPAARPHSADAVRELLMPWAGAAPAPAASSHSHREVVAAIDSPRNDPQLWEEVPVAELAGSSSRAIPIAKPRKQRGDDGRREVASESRQVLLYLLTGCGIIFVLALWAVLFILLRRL